MGAVARPEREGRGRIDILIEQGLHFSLGDGTVVLGAIACRDQPVGPLLGIT